MRVTLLIIIVFFTSVTALFGQHKPEHLVQLSGLVITEDSTTPIPYANIYVLNTYRGTVSTAEGFFSIVIRQNDIIEISAMGFKKRRVILPESFDGDKFYTLVAMEKDTIVFREAMIYPWPSRERFKEQFLAMDVQKDALDRTKENLSQDKILALLYSLPLDGPENQTVYLHNQSVRAGYLGGQTDYAVFPGTNFPVPLSLMSPTAWYEFFKALKEGKFKRKDR